MAHPVICSVCGKKFKENIFDELDDNNNNNYYTTNYHKSMLSTNLNSDLNLILALILV